MVLEVVVGETGFALAGCLVTTETQRSPHRVYTPEDPVGTTPGEQRWLGIDFGGL
ncbi:hypothetical protein [Chlamydia suis]|uniref:hypothetical protein n=1 Tax=Chlamydia suis TaxID=83559 RepID=UPI0013A557FB|nr:hypothetical protein [Chlamydia suis]